MNEDYKLGKTMT